MDEPILFYNKFRAHRQFSEFFIDALRDAGKSVVVLDGYMSDSVDEASRYYIDNKFEIYNILLKCKMYVTPASNLKYECKPARSKAVHIFHSLVSMHLIYGDDGFDNYEYFIGAGPHHLLEFNAIKEIRGLRAAFYKVGYPKVDELTTYAGSNLYSSDRKVICIAPSWHKENIINSDLESTIAGLIDNGYYVKLRPHPHSFLYQMGDIKYLSACFGKNDFTIEDSSIDFLASLSESDLLISDWSGVAYEFAFALTRPVLFINSQQKISSKTLKDLGLPAMEKECRERVGFVIDKNEICSAVSMVFNNYEALKESIESARDSYLYNHLDAVEVGKAALINISEDIYGAK
ncbi:CDP-glycerol glycerophosphotransferase family protein [Motiliproteus sp.]|uniref:CDP-glycerol glycerophosphotransferase family protein n=1 Tax=Motiliproteus sp. TaxID=1898955 RepID=UPI003BABEF1D